MWHRVVSWYYQAGTRKEMTMELTGSQRIVLEDVRQGVYWTDEDGLLTVHCMNPGLTLATEVDAMTLDALDELFNAGLIEANPQDTVYLNGYKLSRICDPELG
jgi:hypothetical protein